MDVRGVRLEISASLSVRQIKQQWALPRLPVSKKKKMMPVFFFLKEEELVSAGL